MRKLFCPVAITALILNITFFSTILWGSADLGSVAGTRMTSGNLIMDAVVGQPATGASGNLVGGFLGFEAAPRFVAGDADGSHELSIGDAVVIINFVFAGGIPPKPIMAGDADCSGAVSIGDAVFIINYIFAEGPSPHYCF